MRIFFVFTKIAIFTLIAVTFACSNLLTENELENEENFSPDAPDIVKISPEDNFLDNDFELKLSCTTSGSTIYYTLDGTDPRNNTALVYTGQVLINRSVNIRAIAMKEDLYSHEESRKDYFIKSSHLYLTIRDFRSWRQMQNSNDDDDGFINGRGHPDFDQYSGTGATKGLVEEFLGDDGLPVFKSDGTGSTNGKQITSSDSFYSWYRDTPGINYCFTEPFPFPLQKNSNGFWEFSNNAFFPIDNEGYGNNSPNYTDHNYGFTTETELLILYEGYEKIIFTGDDDIWIFLNGRLIIDLGGLHSSLSGEFFLTDDYASKNGLEKGELYSLKIFHAERFYTGSNYSVSIKAKLFRPISK